MPAPDGWLIMEGDHEPQQFELLQNSAGMVLGRKNYEGFAAVWPSMAGDGRWGRPLESDAEVGGIDHAHRPAGVELGEQPVVRLRRVMQEPLVIVRTFRRPSRSVLGRTSRPYGC